MNTIKRLGAGVAMLFSLLAATPIQAAIIYTANNSWEEDYSYGYSYSTPATDPDYWSTRSSLGTYGFSDRGSSYSYSFGSRLTAFDIDFTLDIESPFALAARIGGAGYTRAGYRSTVDVTLYAGNTQLYRLSSNGQHRFDGVLDAGDYRLVARAFAGYPSDVEYVVHFTTFNTPLPAGAWLLLSGGLGMGLAAYRGRTRRADDCGKKEKRGRSELPLFSRTQG